MPVIYASRIKDLLLDAVRHGNLSCKLKTQMSQKSIIAQAFDVRQKQTLTR